MTSYFVLATTIIKIPQLVSWFFASLNLLYVLLVQLLFACGCAHTVFLVLAASLEPFCYSAFVDVLVVCI